MAPFVRKHRPGARGATLALTVRVMSEALLAASRLRARLGRVTRSA
jgi:hypothetical protein